MSVIIRQIGEIQGFVTVRETHHDETVITQHPVEKGAQISDHVYRQPSVLMMQVGWSNSKQKTDDPTYLRTIYDSLRALQTTLITIITGKRVYKNMLIQSIEHTTDEETEFSLLVSLTLREVIVTETKSVTFTPPDVQSEPQTTSAPRQEGKKQLKPVTKKTPSWLQKDFNNGVG